MSRGFLASLAGIGMTLLAWFGPWEWPAWPAFAIIRVAFGTQSNFADLPFSTRAAFMVVLIVANVATWALIFGGALTLARGAIRRLRASTTRAD